MKKLFLFIVIFTLRVTLIAQDNQERILRGEILVKDVESVSFVPIGENGLITLAKLEKNKATDGNWEISCFDINFKLKWKTLYKTPSYSELLKYQLDKNNKLHLFFSDGTELFNSFTLVTINLFKGEIENSSTLSLGKFSVNSIDVLNNNTFVTGTSSPGFFSQLGQVFFTFTLVPIITGAKIYSVKSVISCYFSKTKNITNFIPNLKGDSRILCSAVDSFKNRFICILENQHKRVKSFYFLEFDEQGNNTAMNKLENITKSINSAQLISSSKGELFLAGTYSDNGNVGSSKSYYSDGLFFGKIENANNPTSKYYSFGQLQSANSFLSNRARRKVAQNPEKVALNIDLRILLHSKVEMVDSTYILIGETYYPEYHEITNYDARGYLYSSTVFDGYRYTNALAAGFDKEGNLLWDNIIEMGDVLNFKLIEKVVFYADSVDQAMVYYSDGILNAQIFQKGKNIGPKVADIISTVNKNEKVLTEDYGNIYYWYKSYFLITSYQKVLENDGRKRKVYSFNKISFQ